MKYWSSASYYNTSIGVLNYSDSHCGLMIEGDSG